MAIRGVPGDVVWNLEVQARDRSAVKRILNFTLLWMATACAWAQDGAVAVVARPPAGKGGAGDADGAWSYDSARGSWKSEIESQWGDGPVSLEVIAPPANTAAAPAVVYVLPTQSSGTDHGDPLGDVILHHLASRLGVIFAYVHFSGPTWFGENPLRPTFRPDLALREDVVPAVERRFHADPRPSHRLLMGFSKSGWGAVCMLARAPDFWGYAATWDAPLLSERSEYGLWDTDSYGTPESFELQRPAVLLAIASFRLHAPARIILAGECIPGPGTIGQFKDRSDVRAEHRLLDALGIPHVYRPHMRYQHHWNSGWFHHLAEQLVQLSRKAPLEP